MTEYSHFENLWEASEVLNKKTAEITSVSAIVQEIVLKVQLYQAIEEDRISFPEKDKVKSQIFGEVLFTLTQLSMKENVDVFSALKSVLEVKASSPKKFQNSP